MYAQFLLEFEQKMYPYERLDLLKISIFENRREGILPDRLFKLVPEDFGYSYCLMDVDEILGLPVEKPVQQLGQVA